VTRLLRRLVCWARGHERAYVPLSDVHGWSTGIVHIWYHPKCPRCGAPSRYIDLESIIAPTSKLGARARLRRMADATQRSERDG
jgi:hypothetical protein